MDQFIGTGLLLFVIFAVNDEQNNGGLPGYMRGVAVTICILVIGLAYGANIGFPLNPARDFGPRFFTLIAGWGSEVFSRESKWWVPIVGPFIGGFVGSVLYQLLLASDNPEATTIDVDVPEVATDDAETEALISAAVHLRNGGFAAEVGGGATATSAQAAVASVVRKMSTTAVGHRDAGGAFRRSVTDLGVVPKLGGSVSGSSSAPGFIRRRIRLEVPEAPHSFLR